MKSRPRIAFFEFASCEGCQLQVANLGEQLLDILGLVDLVEFRELMSETWSGHYDLAVIEGSIASDEGAAKLRKIRARTDKLIAYGACATNGGVNGMRNSRPLAAAQATVYGDRADWFPVGRVRAIHQVVKVDYFVHGCPIHPDEFIKVLKSALAGLPYSVPDYAVCVECKFNENVCVYDHGVTCLGPITRAGCDSWCINHGNVCYGCRGMVSNPNRAGAEAVLSRYGLKPEALTNKLNLYGSALETGDE